MIPPNINFRILLLAVLPTTVVSIIFFSYFVKKQIDDIEAKIVDKGNFLAVHLASASEYGVFSGNMTILSPLIETAFTKNDIVSITITNNQGNPLIQKSRFKDKPSATSTLKKTHKRIFSQPIIQRSVDINDFDNTNNNMSPVIGWTIIEISNEVARQNKQNAILQTLSITLLILLSSIFLAMRTSRYIIKSISPLSNVANKTKTKKLRKPLKLLGQKNPKPTISQQQEFSEHQKKSTFFPTHISHKIKTASNGILDVVTLLKNTNLTQKQVNHLYAIEQSTRNLLCISNDIFDSSRIEAKKRFIGKTQFNLEECIEDVLILIAPFTHEKGIEISSLYYSDTPKALFGAINCIRQVLINLIGNAIKFSDQGTIMVRTMLESQKNETVQIKISITDQGSGISEKDTNILSNFFSSIDGSDTQQYHGAGLGLAISKSLTETMHGKIGVEKGEDEGSTFWFTFQCQSQNTPKLISKSEPLPYANKSITLYDANELTRISLIHAFRRLGFEVVECLDIENLCTPPETSSMPDICVLSINSHEASEITTQKFLETYRDHTHSKIFVIVSKSDPLTLKTLRDWGADACLSKPFRQTDFEKKLSTIFHSPKNSYAPKTKETYQQPTTFTQLAGLNILIAEDNEINATLIETILHRSGAIPHIVDNGKKAVTAFNNKNKFDVILMDIHMPEMNGVDAAREIRKTESSSTHIGIIGLTAASQNKNGPLSQNPDFDEILEKPIAVNALLSAITYWTQVGKSSKNNRRTDHNTTGDLGIDKDLSMTLNEMLLRELPEAKQKLQAAHDSADQPFLFNETHRLLGGMAYCDFTKLHQLTLQYRESLKENEDTMNENFQKMITEMERLLTTENP